jgi:1,4-alpha-glucan branching enzyme
VPEAGLWREIMNSDGESYGGSGVGNGGRIESEPIAWHGREQSVVLRLPPLAGLLLVCSRNAAD